MTKRDRRQTPKSTSLALGSQSSIDKMFDDWLSDAVPPDGMESKADTASVNVGDTNSAFCDKPTLNGEGTKARVIPDSNISDKEAKKKRHMSRAMARNNYRVPVLNPDGTPAMPTTNRRANKWLKEKRAKVIKNDLGIFQIQLLFEPSGRNKQDIVAIVDPGSAFTVTTANAVSRNYIQKGCISWIDVRASGI